MCRLGLHQTLSINHDKWKQFIILVELHDAPIGLIIALALARHFWISRERVIKGLVFIYSLSDDAVKH